VVQMIEILQHRFAPVRCARGVGEADQRRSQPPATWTDARRTAGFRRVTGPDSLATSALEIPREWFRSNRARWQPYTAWGSATPSSGFRIQAHDRAASRRLRQLDGQVNSGTSL
jgi:hypothetical protein